MSKILDVLKKLVRLSVNNSNEHEAQAAMLKAQQIAIQNNIDLAKVSLEDEERSEYLKDSRNIGQRMSICHKFSVNLIINFFNVAIVTGGNRNYGRYIHFIGTKSNVEFAKFAYDYLNDTFLNCWRKYKQDHNKPLCYRETYIFGLYVGLKEKLKENKKKMEESIDEKYKDKYALVLINEEKQLDDAKRGFFNNLKDAKTQTVNLKNSEAYYAGVEQGKKININKAIN